MKDFRKLQVWHKAHAATLRIYQFTKGFPADEKYGLTAQIRNAASSIPSNLAEGCGCGSDRQLARYVDIAMASASELEYRWLLAHDLSYLDRDQHEPTSAAIEEIKRMLAALIKTLNRPARRPLIAEG